MSVGKIACACLLLALSPWVSAFEPLPLGAPQTEPEGEGEAIEIIVNPVSVGPNGRGVTRSERLEYFGQVEQYIQAQLEAASGQSVAVKSLAGTEYYWEKHLRITIPVGGRNQQTDIDITVANAINRFRIDMKGLTYSDIRSMTQNLHRKIKNGGFGSAFRVPSDISALLESQTNFLKNDLSVAIEGYVDMY